VNSLTREFLAGASASVFLVGLTFFGHFPLLLSLGLSAAVYFGIDATTTLDIATTAADALMAGGPP